MCDIKNKVCKIIDGMVKNDNIDKASIKEDTDLFDAGLLDSLNMIILITALQNEFNIEFEIEELIPQNLGTIEAITGFVKSRCNRE